MSAEKLKEARHAAGLSQAKLAAAAGIPRMSIARYEQGYRDLSLASASVVLRIAKALNVSVEDLIN